MADITNKMNYIESKISSKDVKFLIKSFEDYKKHLEKLKKVYKVDTEEEAQKILYDKYYDMFFSNNSYGIDSRKQIVKRTDVTASDFFLNDALIDINRNPSLLWEKYDLMNQQERFRMIKDKKACYSYNSNIDDTIYSIFSDIGNHVCELAKIPVDSFIRGLSVDERLRFQKTFNECVKGHRVDGRKDLIAAYSSRIVKMVTLLDDIGELESSTHLYNLRLRQEGLDDLQVEYEKKKKGNKPQLAASKDLKDIRLVQNLPFETLAMYNVFFANRVNKVFRNQSLALFVQDQIGDKEITDLSEDELKAILIKHRFIQSVERERFTAKYNEISNKVNAQELEKGENSIYCDDIDLTELEVDRVAYKKYFDKILPGFKNEFDDDAIPVFSNSSIFEGMLSHKDFAIKALIYNLMKGSNKTFVNWGYIPEEVDGKNSIERNKVMVLIGVDHENFNQPIRFHMSKKDLLGIVKGITGKSDIPVYEGDVDWNIDNRNQDFTSTPIALPMTKYARSALSKYLTTVNKAYADYNFVEHLAWMSRQIGRPSRLPDEIVSLDTGIISPNVRTMDDDD